MTIHPQEFEADWQLFWLNASAGSTIRIQQDFLYAAAASETGLCQVTHAPKVGGFFVVSRGGGGVSSFIGAQVNSADGRFSSLMVVEATVSEPVPFVVGVNRSARAHVLEHTVEITGEGLQVQPGAAGSFACLTSLDDFAAATSPPSPITRNARYDSIVRGTGLAYFSAEVVGKSDLEIEGPAGWSRRGGMTAAPAADGPEWLLWEAPAGEYAFHIHELDGVDATVTAALLDLPTSPQSP